MIRLFAAIPVPNEVATSLSAHQNGLKGARWRPAEALHVTLRFFGEVNERQAEDIASALESTAGPRFQLELSGVGHFGEGDRLHAVWAGVAENPELRALAARCESAARRAGCAPEPRNYLPHVTLAYLKHAAPADIATWEGRNNLLKSSTFSIERFGLYSSWRSDGANRYELEQFYRLG